MSAFDLIEERSHQIPFILTPEEYQALCVAVCELAPEQQAEWDNTILYFTYDGKTFSLDTPQPVEQGGAI